MASITVPDSTPPFSASVKFLDAKGAETVPDTVPVWSSSDESAATVEASEDGLTATITIGTPGDESTPTVIDVMTTETNTGEEIHAQGTITVTPGDTTMGEVSFDVPTA